MNELKFQGHIVDEANDDLKGHAFKCNNRFLVGVADLSIKIPKFPHVYWEAKKLNRLRGIQKIDLTPHQRKFLKDYRKAGGVSGWIVFAPLKGKRDFYEIYASADLEATTFDFKDGNVSGINVRQRGGPWGVEFLIMNTVKGAGFRETTYS